MYWKSTPGGVGGMPTWPAATCWLCCCSACMTSCGIEAARLQLLRVEPDAHGVLAGAEDDDVADAGQPRQLVLEADRGVVRQIEAVVAAVRRGQA